MRLPSTNLITLEYGARTDPYTPDSPHNGIDFGYNPDPTIYAPFSGIAVQVPNNGRDGNGTYMHNANQFHGLLHASKYLVPNNTYVQEGQPIAVMGDTGFAKGVHLHWCVKVNNVFIDPMTLIPNTLTNKEQPMTKQEAIAILDAFYGRFTGRKVKDSELEEYVPILLSGNPDKFLSKAAVFDEVRRFIGAPIQPDIKPLPLEPGIYEVK
jgi:hypothetical protein